jgi:hypothetical protein
MFYSYFLFVSVNSDISIAKLHKELLNKRRKFRYLFLSGTNNSKIMKAKICPRSNEIKSVGLKIICTLFSEKIGYVFRYLKEGLLIQISKFST